MVRGRGKYRLIVLEYRAPSGLVVVAGVAGLLALFPSAVLELDPRSAGFGGETKFNLGASVPTWCTPGEGHHRWWPIGGHPSDLVFGAIAAPFIEEPSDFPFEVQLAVFAAEATRPPVGHILAEHFEGNLRRAFDSDRLANRHFFFSA
jgi:hypothetical protein